MCNPFSPTRCHSYSQRCVFYTRNRVIGYNVCNSLLNRTQQVDHPTCIRCVECRNKFLCGSVTAWAFGVTGLLTHRSSVFSNISKILVTSVKTLTKLPSFPREAITKCSEKERPPCQYFQIALASFLILQASSISTTFPSVQILFTTIISFIERSRKGKRKSILKAISVPNMRICSFYMWFLQQNVSCVWRHSKCNKNQCKMKKKERRKKKRDQWPNQNDLIYNWLKLTKNRIYLNMQLWILRVERFGNFWWNPTETWHFAFTDGILDGPFMEGKIITHSCFPELQALAGNVQHPRLPYTLHCYIDGLCIIIHRQCKSKI